MPIKTYQLNSRAARAAFAAIGVLAVISAFSVAKWGFAHTAAIKADTIDVASLAVDFAPGDPQTHYALAVLSEKTFVSEDLENAVKEFEAAAALSPFNYLLWLDLGRARERIGDKAGAERALRKALELAPNYSRVQWALGNVLLRQGKNDNAFVEIRKAVAGDAAYTNAAAMTTWQILDGDIAKVRNAIGDSDRANASLATLLVNQNRFDEAVDIWNRLPADEKKTTLKEAGQALYIQFLEAGKYRHAARVGEQIGISQNGGEFIGVVANGGFEEPVVSENSNIFSWKIADGTNPRIGPTDGQKHSGNYSLLMSFAQGSKITRPVSQMVPIEPGKSYLFEAFYRSDVKTQAKLKWEVVTAANGKLIEVTDALMPSADWTPVRITFDVPKDIDGVTIRFAAQDCDPAICSISGNIWFDDFTLRSQ